MASKPNWHDSTRRSRAGLRFVQVRDKRLPTDDRARFAGGWSPAATAHGAIVVVNDDAALASRIGADGVHSSAAALAQLAAKPDFAWVGASCHSQEALAHERQWNSTMRPRPGAANANASRTRRHRLGRLCGNGGAIAATGVRPRGMRPDLLPIAQGHGAHGIALMRGWSANAGQ